MRVIETFDQQSYATTKTLAYLKKFQRYASRNLIKKLCRAITLRANDTIVVFDIDDTLVRSDSKPLTEVVKLYKDLAAMQAKIYLVTARHPSMRKETITELESIGITSNDYEKLLITPSQYRTDMKKVGEWKFFARQSIAIQHGAPIALTVGDQWTDMFKISEEEMFLLDEAYPQPFVFGFVKDDISLMFLKLKNMHK